MTIDYLGTLMMGLTYKDHEGVWYVIRGIKLNVTKSQLDNFFEDLKSLLAHPARVSGYKVFPYDEEIWRKRKSLRPIKE